MAVWGEAAEVGFLVVVSLKWLTSEVGGGRGGRMGRGGRGGFFYSGLSI